MMRPTLICGTLLAASLLVSSAQAVEGFMPGGFHPGQHFPGFGFGTGFFGYRSSNSLYGLGYIPVPPYYALHPPVYYSHPIPHPYGSSPFARLPARGWGDYVSVQPVVNPYVVLGTESVGQDADTADAPTTAAASPMIANPYYRATERELAQAE